MKYEKPIYAACKRNRRLNKLLRSVESKVEARESSTTRNPVRSGLKLLFAPPSEQYLFRIDLIAREMLPSIRQLTL
jgi:hypothetical protein